MADELKIIVLGEDQASAVFGAIDGALGNLGDATTQAASSGGLFASAFQNATNILSSFEIVKGVASSVAGLAQSFVAGNAEFERYETQFGVLLGSASAAKDRLAELAQFGATTPFELPELVQADKVLTSFGLDSATTAAKFGVSAQQIRTTIGDVAAGTGVKFQELALTFGKFASGATGEAVARFQELGIATKQEMAEWGLQFSKSGQLLTPAAEAFTVLEAHVRQKFGGMMAAQSQTFEGMISNLQDWWGATKRTIAEPIFDQLKVGLGAALQFLGSPAVMGAIQGVAQAIADGIGGTIQWFSDTAIPAFIAAWGMLQPAISVAAAVIGEAIPLISAVGDAILGFGDLGTVADLVQNFGDTVSAALAAAFGPDVAAAFQPVYDWLYTMLPDAVGALASAVALAPDAINELIAAFTGFGAETYDTLDSVRDLLSALGLSPAMVDMVDGAIRTLGGALQGVIGLFSDLATGFATADEWSSSAAETFGTLAAQLLGFFLGIQTGSDAFWTLQAPLQSAAQLLLGFDPRRDVGDDRGPTTGRHRSGMDGVTQRLNGSNQFRIGVRRA